MVLFRKAAREVLGLPPLLPFPTCPPGDDDDAEEEEEEECECSLKLAMALALASNGQLGSLPLNPIASSMADASFALKSDAADDKGPPAAVSEAREDRGEALAAAAAAALHFASRAKLCTRCLFAAWRRRHALMEVSRTRGPSKGRGTTEPWLRGPSREWFVPCGWRVPGANTAPSPLYMRTR